MKRLKYLLLLALLSSFIACSKDSDDLISPELDDYNDAPVFSFSANEGEYLIQAGVNDFYMFTEYFQDTMGNYSFIGRFAKLPNCSINCNEELSFRISISSASQFPSPDLVNEVFSTTSFDIGNANSTSASGNVWIEYRDQDDVTYRTDLLENIESSFNILSIDEYNRNENDEPTKILRVTFDAELKSTESEDIIFFNNAEAVIAIAYPE